KNDEGKGRVEVIGLRVSSREEVRQIKSASPSKVYRVEIAINGKVNKEKINEVLQSFKRTRITQQTPVRVSHRRADLARERMIIDTEMVGFDDPLLTLVIKTEAGTYVKEFVHGDNGRTNPSLSGALGVPCEVKSLDVIDIADDTGDE
ncbi:MAG: tRNA pseudouridine(54/55) synthase Pus10, partial [Deltaproteobacteria bacterium]|nr:tRNA pseudouridine(54/55) synthase Pus10 [Deltaproteobacteria bacterium]